MHCPRPRHGVAAWRSRRRTAKRLRHFMFRQAKDGPTVLFFPGNGDNIADYGFLGDLLSARGSGLLAVSYRGYPGSTGSPTEAGLLTDGLAAFDWLSTQDRSSPIVILGRSLGTGVAVNTAAERDAVAVVLISAYEFDPGGGARQISLPSCCSADERQFSLRSPDRRGFATKALSPRRSRQVRPVDLRQGTVRRGAGAQDVQRPARLWPQRHLDSGSCRGRDRLRRFRSGACTTGLSPISSGKQGRPTICRSPAPGFPARLTPPQSPARGRVRFRAACRGGST